MDNYLTYPLKTMRITQSYTGTTSHLPHTTGTPKDYPIDDGGKNGGKDAIYCPCDSVKVFRVYGVGNKGVNTLFLQSAEKVDFADGTRDYFCALLTHPDDADLSALALGKTFRRGDVICHEGSDGGVGNHIHLSAGKGKVTGTGWRQNSKRKWVLTCTGGACKPEELFFLDPAFTTVKDSKDLRFRTLPTDLSPAERRRAAQGFAPCRTPGGRLLPRALLHRFACKGQLGQNAERLGVFGLL